MLGCGYGGAVGGLLVLCLCCVCAVLVLCTFTLNPDFAVAAVAGPPFARRKRSG
jgi:hypothetical protein